jgi:aspartyl-tRNA(Asn)/glutamyl-tRNA(Gln) amidotransferase subunit A
MTLLELSGAVESHEASPEEITRAFLQRIEALNPTINAYITVTAAEALREARKATEELARSERRGPLHGLPLGLKDLFETQGVLTTAGSRILAEWVPNRDAHCVALLRRAGAIFLGKLNLHEFALGGTTINPHYGPTRNPWDLQRIPGGSSGGSGAAVMAGLCPAATGSDTAGSIRIPASLCGIVGLKPTYGLVSLRGVVPLCSSLDHAGPLTLTVADSALLLEVMAGPDPEDPYSAQRPPDGYLDGLNEGVRGLRLGLPRNYFYEGAHLEVAAAVEEAARVLEGLGATIVELELPMLENTERVGGPVLRGESYAYHRHNLEERPQDYGEQVRLLLQTGEQFAASDYIQAQWARHGYTRSLEQTFEDVDALLSPTCLIPALTIEECLEKPMVPFALIHNTLPFDMTGQPALSVPCGFSSGGLPIGLQISGRRFDEATVLKVGAAYEAATDWHTRRPALT